MKHIVGSAIKINSEVSIVTGVTVSLEKLTDPNGLAILENQSMAFSTVNSSVAFAVWQSSNSSVLGRYKYKTKASNGSNSDTEIGYFYLQDS